MTATHRLIDPAPPPGDTELLPRLRSGDPDAIRILYYRHAAPLLALAARITGHSCDAEDVVQDLFVGLPEALARYQEKGQFTAWLRTLTIRLALMRLRSARRRRETPLQPAEGRIEEMDDQSGDIAALRVALRALPDDLRVIVVLHSIEGYSHAEIAEVVGIRRNTSEVRLHRALRRLRKALEA